MNVFDVFFIVFLLMLFGIIGLLLRQRNIIFILINIELLLLAVNFGFFTFSTYHDDITGQGFSLFILAVAAAEAAIGLALLIAYYRIAGTIQTDNLSELKG
jgi:NADH-quinone oxidoreductase subunit K